MDRKEKVNWTINWAQKNGEIFFFQSLFNCLWPFERERIWDPFLSVLFIKIDTFLDYNSY